MGRLKMLIMAHVPGAQHVQQHDHQAGIGASHAAGCLDVLAGGFGLIVNGHQAQAVDVNTHGQHIAGQYIFISSCVRIMHRVQMIPYFRDFPGGFPAGQLIMIVFRAGDGRHVHSLRQFTEFMAAQGFRISANPIQDQRIRGTQILE